MTVPGMPTYQNPRRPNASAPLMSAEEINAHSVWGPLTLEFLSDIPPEATVAGRPYWKANTVRDYKFLLSQKQAHLGRPCRVSLAEVKRWRRQLDAAIAKEFASR